jgi:nitric oxide synthase-interacting protein
MARKSKQPGGNMPLTQYERKIHGGAYGTQSARLTTDSQLRFGDCCLSLTAAVDPVVTPSGHIYSREAIVAYLLEKKKEIKENTAKYEAKIALVEQNRIQDLERKDEQYKKDFLKKDQGSTHITVNKHQNSLIESSKRKIDMESKDEGQKRLKHVSYWLAEAQPQANEDDIKNPPNQRPSSPMTGNDLRLKDLKSITLEREDGTSQAKCICAVSHKAITTQPVVLIKKTGVVLLKDVYEKVVRTKSGDMVCPISGKKIKEKDVMELKKASSGFSASGQVVATSYTPTMT